jgi:hypothetical protein
MICVYLYYSFKFLAFEPPPKNMSFIFEQQQWKIQKESKGNKNIFIFLILNIKKTRLSVSLCKSTVKR